MLQVHHADDTMAVVEEGAPGNAEIRRLSAPFRADLRRDELDTGTEIWAFNAAEIQRHLVGDKICKADSDITPPPTAAADCASGVHKEPGQRSSPGQAACAGPEGLETAGG